MKSRTTVRNVRISTKSAVLIARRLKGKYILKAKKFLESMISEKADIDGKHYTKTCKEMLRILDSAEKNAVDRGMDEERLVVVSINCSPGTRIARQRWRGVGSRMKMTNVIVLLTQSRKPFKESKKVGEEKKEVKKEKKEEKPKKKKEEKDEEKSEAVKGKTVKAKPKEKVDEKKPAKEGMK